MVPPSESRPLQGKNILGSLHDTKDMGIPGSVLADSAEVFLAEETTPLAEANLPPHILKSSEEFLKFPRRGFHEVESETLGSFWSDSGQSRKRANDPVQ
jgi:hypothetical protein